VLPAAPVRRLRCMSKSQKRRSRVTGHRHPDCYANVDCDCSCDISKEHYISEVLLRRIQLNGLSKVAGLAWQMPQTFDRIPTKDFAANILCERHNRRLSRLDNMIGGFADAIRDVDRGARKLNIPIKVNGPLLERWMLKALLGLTASGNMTSHLKPECLALLFERQSWPETWGLYFNLQQREIYHTDSILIETMTAPDEADSRCEVFRPGSPVHLSLRPSRQSVSLGHLAAR